MTLSIGTRFQSVLDRSCTIIAISFLLSVSLFSSLAEGHNVNSADQFNGQLLLSPGCLLVNEAISADQPTVVIATTSAAAENSKEIAYDVFPMEGPISDVANKIVNGIVNSIPADEFTQAFRESYDSLVNLNVLVGDTVEASATQEDPYWNYYLSCDGWNVAFNSKPEFGAQSIASHEREVKEEDKAQRRHLIKELKHLYLSMEFLLVEQLKTEQLASPFESSETCCHEILTPISGIVDISRLGTFGIWNSLHARIEMASRVMYGLRFASKIGDQFLESSRQSVQY